MVGHYWLRDAARAPTPQLRQEIDSTLQKIHQFVADVHGGKIKTPAGKPFTDLLIVGIGGSALGPQFVSDALTSPADKLCPHFFDNTDPDGMDRALLGIGNKLDQTLTVVISKSGGTKETRNGMLAAAAAYKAVNLNFAKFAVAITGDGSELDKVAASQGWITRFPMWDWVGGRTSELSAVGLLPAALQGIDINAMLAGARDCDQLTRMYGTTANPSALLALMWYHAGGGKGLKDMVVLPYKDRLMFLSKYLQQLVMESLGKQLDRKGKTVNQGIAVYGNKGSTDQHAYVQQLREGVNNFFATFIEVLCDRTALSGKGSSSGLMVEPDVTSGDYLHGFFQGTRTALYEHGRESMTITVEQVSPRTHRRLDQRRLAANAPVGLYRRKADRHQRLPPARRRSRQKSRQRRHRPSTQNPRLPARESEHPRHRQNKSPKLSPPPTLKSKTVLPTSSATSPPTPTTP